MITVWLPVILTNITCGVYSDLLAQGRGVVYMIDGVVVFVVFSFFYFFPFFLHQRPCLVGVQQCMQCFSCYALFFLQCNITNVTTLRQIPPLEVHDKRVKSKHWFALPVSADLLNRAVGAWLTANTTCAIIPTSKNMQRKCFHLVTQHSAICVSVGLLPTL